MRNHYRVAGPVSNRTSDLKTVPITVDADDFGGVLRPEIFLNGSWFRTRLVETDTGLEVVIPTAADTPAGANIDTTVRIRKPGRLILRLIRLGFTEYEASAMERDLSYAECHFIASYISEAGTADLRKARTEIVRIGLDKKTLETI